MPATRLDCSRLTTPLLAALLAASVACGARDTDAAGDSPFDTASRAAAVDTTLPPLDIVADSSDSTWREVRSDRFGIALRVPSGTRIVLAAHEPPRCFHEPAPNAEPRADDPLEPPVRETFAGDSTEFVDEWKLVVHQCRLPDDSIFFHGRFDRDDGRWRFVGEGVSGVRLIGDASRRWLAMSGSGIVRIYDSAGFFAAHGGGSDFIARLRRRDGTALVLQYVGPEEPEVLERIAPTLRLTRP